MGINDTMSNRREGPSRRRVGLVVGAAIVAMLGAGVAVTGLVQAATHAKRPPVPQSSEVEGKAGIRVTRVSLAGDGGLLDVRYIVLDPSLATRWTGDTDKPPIIGNERTHERFDRVAAMRDGHDLRPGQTYYLLYLNQGGNVHRGDKVDLEIAGTKLTGVPVE
jgi:hypothetical protein